MKSGKLDGFKKTDIQEIDELVKAGIAQCPFPDGTLQCDFFKLQSYLHPPETAFPDLASITNPLHLKAISISLEFRDYLEELPPDHWQLLATLSGAALDEFRVDPPELRTSNVQELLKEKVRLVSIYANQLRRQHRYEASSEAVEAAKRIVLHVLRPGGMQCNTVLGTLFYVESKLLRDSGRYRECEERLTRAVECYSAWVMENTDDRKNIQLASYKIAQFLGDTAWCKNSRGFREDALALINAARLFIWPTEWELDKAHLDLIYADVERAFIGTNSSELQRVISIVDRSYRTFTKHPHKRMQARAAFALALLNFYAGNLRAAEQHLRLAEQFSQEKKDTKWLVNCRNLLARIRIKQDRADEALSFLSESIDEAVLAKLMNQLVVAHTVRGEALCLLGRYNKAFKSFDEAQWLNEKRIGAGIEVNSERNRGWILLSRAHAHLLDDNVRQATVCLEMWEHMGGVQLEWLNEKAKQIRREVAAQLPKDFIIGSDAQLLDWKGHQRDLLTWLINQAKSQSKSEKNSEIAKALGIGVRRLGQLKRQLKNDPTPKVIFPRRKKKVDT